MNCSYMSHLVFICIFVWSVAIFRTLDGISISWNEPPPFETVTDSRSTSTTNTSLTKGSLNEELSCSFNLSVDMTLVTVTFEFGGVTVASYFDRPSVENSYASRYNATWVPTKLTLIVFNVTSDDKGEYVCRVQANAGGLKTWQRKIAVDLLVQSQITNISGETVIEGLNVSLRCLFEGNPQPNFTWTRVSDNRVVTMPLIDVRRQDAGEYRCIADNGVGKPASETVWLIVKFAPENASLSTNLSTIPVVCTGMVVNFTCTVEAANPAVDTFILFENGNMTANKTDSGVWIKTLDTGGEVTYKCQAINSLGTSSSSKTLLSVNVPASVMIESDKIVVLEGRNVTLHCLPYGVPSPKVWWMDFSKNNMEDGSILKFPNISRHKSGSYTCSATNVCGSDQKKVDIVVEYPPEVNGTGQNATVAKGVKHTFYCPVDGNPEPHIKWFNEKTGAKVSSEKQLEANESGCYTCVANNSLGTPVNITQCLTIREQVKARIKIKRDYPEKDRKEFEIWFEREVDRRCRHFQWYIRAKVTNMSPGSVIVDFIVYIRAANTEENRLEKLRAAISVNGTFGHYKAGDLVFLRDESATSTTRRSPKPTVSADPPWVVIGAVAGGVVLLAILVGVLTWWVHQQRKCRKDTKIHNSDRGRHNDDGGCSQVQGAYAHSGPPAANGPGGAAEQEIEVAAAIPTYAVVDKSKKSKKQADEKPPEYAVVEKSKKKEKQEAAAIPTYAAVDKSKKKKKKSREEVPAVYAEVDKSKKKKKRKIDDKNLYENLDEPKKEKKPGELLYADLGDFQNPSMPAVSISPQPLPAIKKADPYERTDYADITQFLKGNATLPPTDGNGDAEMKPKRPSKKKEIQGNDKETPI